MDLIKNGSRERFWRENTERDKATLDLPALQLEVEKALDQAHWIDTGWAVAPDDENFVDFRTGTECLRQFLASVGGVIKEQNFKGFALQDVTPYWRVWRDFWLEPILIAELQKESLPSALYCTYGLATSLFETQVLKFESDAIRHRQHRGVGVNPECWQCKFEKAQRERQTEQVEQVGQE